MGSKGVEIVENEKQPQSDLPPLDVAAWLWERRADAERRLEDLCQRAVGRLRGVVADEIRGLSRRVEKMHKALDQLEQLVESQGEESETEESDE